MGPVTFNYTGQITAYTVSQGGSYFISAYGAQGASNSGSSDFGGLGASVGGRFTLQADSQLLIIVGGVGQPGDQKFVAGGGGGGGSFVFVDSDRSGTLTLADNLLVAAGGGGGAGSASAGAAGYSADDAGGSGNGSGGAGGAGNYSGGGGAGVIGGGGNGSGEFSGFGASSINGRGAGGGTGGNGGYGGGGGGGRFGGGGGGGFSGGAGGTRSASGGVGGRSYNQSNESDRFTQAGVQSGDGFVRIVCYAQGTRIRTTGGEVAVEALRIGDMVVTASGEHRPIRWIGSQTVDCQSHPKRGTVLPVRIAAGALGENQPIRDLWVSPRHAICLDLLGEVLVPADALINGATITQESVETVTYWHVELDSHDLLIAEGVSAESYLDLGNRGFFAGAAIAPDEAVPGGRATRAQSCRPFAEGDSATAAFARERLRARTVALGWTTQPDPVAGLHVVADGQVIAPSVDGTTVSFHLPPGCGDVWLVSRTTVPALVTDSDDRRHLGVNVRGLTIEGGVAASLKVHLDDARLGMGFHPIQGKAEAPYRWTRGETLLPAALWAGCTGPVTLRLDLGGERLLRWRAPDEQADGIKLAERRRA